MCWKRVPLIRLKHGWCRCTSTTAFEEGALPWPCHFNISHFWYHSILYVFLTPYIVDSSNDFSANVQRLHVWLETHMFHRALRPAKLLRRTLQIDWRTSLKSVRQRQWWFPERFIEVPLPANGALSFEELFLFGCIVFLLSAVQKWNLTAELVWDEMYFVQK